MFSISKVNPARLRQAGVDLVIISNGSHKMSKAYRRIFRTSFALYVDPSLRVYHALGMTLRTLDGGLESERGQYVQHGTVSGIAMVVRNAMRVGMPVWEKGGDIQQLGGEFVLGPGYARFTSVVYSTAFSRQLYVSTVYSAASPIGCVPHGPTETSRKFSVLQVSNYFPLGEDRGPRTLQSANI